MLMKKSNFYIYIFLFSSQVFLGMNRKVLVQGFVRMFIPLVVGTLASVAVGLLVGSLFGFEMKHTFFFIIIPIVRWGGIREGILPLSLAYSDILNESSATFVSQLIPAAIIGNMFAIVSAGI